MEATEAFPGYIRGICGTSFPGGWARRLRPGSAKRRGAERKVVVTDRRQVVGITCLAVGGESGSGFDLLPGRCDLHRPRPGVDGNDSTGRDQHASAELPHTGVDDQVLHAGLVLLTVYVADAPVRGLHGEAHQRLAIRVTAVLRIHPHTAHRPSPSSRPTVDGGLVSYDGLFLPCHVPSNQHSMRRSARRRAKSAAGGAGWVVASATAKALWRRWPLCERRARAGRRKYGNSIRRGGGIVLAHVTNDHGAESNRSAPAGSGKRRAGPRLPEQARGKHSCSPAHARGQASDEAMNGSTPLYSRLAEEWSAEGAAVPCRPDPLWQRLVSFEHFRRETESTLRRLHLGAEAPWEAQRGRFD